MIGRDFYKFRRSVSEKIFYIIPYDDAINKVCQLFCVYDIPLGHLRHVYMCIQLTAYTIVYAQCRLGPCDG